MSSKTVFVFLSLTGETPSLMGRLYAESPRGRETCAFEFDPGWLRDNGGRGFLDPDLRMAPGRQYAPANKEMFGLFSDSCPDRWGRQLMRRWEAISADRENRAPRQLTETDYLLGVCDEARMGALRFALRPEGPFLSAGSDAVPPWAALREMEDASLAFERDGETPNVLRVKKLLAPGAALGGARPKATVKDARGDLWIAKFPSVRDEHDAGAWEQAVHELAKACGLSVPESRLERFSNSGSTYVAKRFDRDGPGRRPFSSAMALLGQTDGADAEGGVGYPDIADLIAAWGARPEEDLTELWKRIVFGMAVSNTDDHLRNHGFLWTPEGWRLSPMYDVNPVPHGKALSLNVSPDGARIDPDLAIEAAPLYGMEKRQARDTAREMLRTVKSLWRPVSERCGIGRAEQRKMEPAFEAAELYG